MVLLLHHERTDQFREGSDWLILGYSTHLETIENYWLWDNLNFPASTAPLLVTNMYKYSNQMDCGVAAAKYIDTFFQNINRGTVTQRIEDSRIAKKATVKS